MGWSVYQYGMNNPLQLVDWNGQWSIRVYTAEHSRHAVLVLYTRNGQEVQRFRALTRGQKISGLSLIKMEQVRNSHTPRGIYRIGDRRKKLVWIWDDNLDSEPSFGPAPRFVIELLFETKRSLFRVHGGDLDKRGRLRPTHGCIRMSNCDIMKLWELTQKLERQDKREEPQTLEVIVLPEQEFWKTEFG